MLWILINLDKLREAELKTHMWVVVYCWKYLDEPLLMARPKYDFGIHQKIGELWSPLDQQPDIFMPPLPSLSCHKTRHLLTMDMRGDNSGKAHQKQ